MHKERQKIDIQKHTTKLQKKTKAAIEERPQKNFFRRKWEINYNWRNKFLKSNSVLRIYLDTLTLRYTIADHKNTMDVIQNRWPFIVLSPSMCYLCGEAGESGNHIFIHCKFTHKVWEFFTSALSLCFVKLDNVVDICNQWGRRPKRGKR